MAYNRDKWTTVVKEANILASQCNRGARIHLRNIPLSCNSMTASVSTMNTKMGNIT